MLRSPSCAPNNIHVCGGGGEASVYYFRIGREGGSRREGAGGREGGSLRVLDLQNRDNTTTDAEERRRRRRERSEAEWSGVRQPTKWDEDR